MNNSLVTRAVGDGTVQLLVESFAQRVGGTTTAEVRLSGDRDRTLRDLTLAFETHYRTADGFETVEVGRTPLFEAVSIESGLETARQAPVSIPYEVPNTLGTCDVEAVLSIDGERAGSEYLDVEPTARFQAALAALLDLGFRMESAECRVDRRDGGPPFVQQFDFSPGEGPFQGDFERLELFVREGPEETTLAAAIDREGDLNPVPEVSTTLTDPVDGEAVHGEVESLVERALES